jgi:hypothetical protein
MWIFKFPIVRRNQELHRQEHRKNSYGRLFSVAIILSAFNESMREPTN